MTGADRHRAAVRAAFADAHGREPDGLWAAPGRVNLIGEHTDYNDGWVLPFALDHETVVAAAPRDDGVLTIRSLQAPDEAIELALDGLEPGGVEGWAAYVAGAAWALAHPEAWRRDPASAAVAVPGADLVLGSTVPSGAGLSSSAALTAATTLALLGLAGASLPGTEHALAARAAEADFAGVAVGTMDQLASVLGRAGHALLIDCRSLEVEEVPFDPEAAGLTLLVLDTRATHDVGDGAYAERREACEAAAAALGLAALRDATEADLDRLDGTPARRARHVVTEDARVLEAVDHLRAGRLEPLGPLLSASHASLRDLYEVSSPELDDVCAAAEGAGALGARMTGAGFGGSAIALVPTRAVDAVREAVLAARPPAQIFVAAPAQGARRLE